MKWLAGIVGAFVGMVLGYLAFLIGGGMFITLVLIPGLDSSFMYMIPGETLVGIAHFIATILELFGAVAGAVQGWKLLYNWVANRKYSPGT